MLKSAFVGVLFTLTGLSANLFSQTIIPSNSGSWYATVEVVPTGIVPTTNDCPWGYNYNVQFTFKVSFYGNYGSNGINFQVYFDCLTGTGGSLFKDLGYFQGSTQISTVTTNNAKYVSATKTAYNYVGKPSCNQIDLSNAYCNTVKVKYWGNDVGNGSVTIPISGGNALPVELVSFDAAVQNNQTVLLHWVCASEKNNDYFTIERTTDGVTFESIGTVRGAGNSSTKNDYLLTDYHPLKGLSYYRLKQTDYNGDSKMYDLISVNTPEGYEEVHIYPNPSRSGKVTVDFSHSEASGHTVKIYSLMGQLLKTDTVTTSENGTSISYDLPEGDAFVFELLASDNSKPQHIKVLKGN